MALTIKVENSDYQFTQEDITSQRVGGALFVAGIGVTICTAAAGLGTEVAGAAGAGGNCTGEVISTAERVDQLLQGDPGYNVSPEWWFRKYVKLVEAIRISLTSNQWYLGRVRGYGQ